MCVIPLMDGRQMDIANLFSQTADGATQAVVDYFLNEIPGQARGTNKLGVTINLAADIDATDANGKTTLDHAAVLERIPASLRRHGAK